MKKITQNKCKDKISVFIFVYMYIKKLNLSTATISLVQNYYIMNKQCFLPDRLMNVK